MDGKKKNDKEVIKKTLYFIYSDLKMGGKSSKGLSAEWDELKLISIKESFKARIHWLQISNASRSPINFDLSTTDLDYEEMGRIADFMKNNEIFFKTTVTIALVGVQLDQETACKILDAAPKVCCSFAPNSPLVTVFKTNVKLSLCVYDTTLVVIFTKSNIQPPFTTSVR